MASTRIHPVRDLITFYVVVYALSWIVWGTAILQDRDALSFHIPGALAFWSLTIGVPLVALATGGVSALADLASRVVRWRVSVQWYLIGIAFPIVLAMVSSALAAAFGSTIELGGTLSLGSAVGYFIFGIFLFTLTEETAWRGYALPRLQHSMDALPASVIVGVLWGLWHLPLWFIADTDQTSWNFFAFVVLTIAESVLIGWFFNHTRGSVLLAGIFHAASDAALAYSGVLYSDARAFWVAVLVFAVAAVTLVVVDGSKALRRGGLPPEAIYPTG
ncbi:MAG: CPBP family intramembrane metalloprotease [Acidimicrobiia bacterium]|nr:CPBP family intramembrane metalloprotease [Acidimicrobiia bacterium]